LTAENLKKVDGFRKRFVESLENDLNIPGALSIVWEMAKSNIPSPDKYDLIMDFDEVLGLDLAKYETEDNEHETELPEDIQQLIAKRNLLRQEKNFQEADSVRKEIEEKGYTLEDTSRGTVVKK
jgi:cysteinyl-tRNA synthetase